MEGFLKAFEGKNIPPELLAQLRELLPDPVPHLDTIVSRLSLLRTFTAKVYDVAVADLQGSVPALDDFIEAAGARPVIGYEKRWSIGESARAEWLDRWDQARGERADWARRFDGILDPADPVERLDRLQVLFLGDQAAARSALRAAFDDATAANDIARCGALVQVLASVWKFADSESTTLFEEIKGASQARNLFLTEFDQTRKYFPRPLDEELKDFANATDDRWIFHLWATGGMGKTTMLRRLISHEWVVGAARRPCAWLDLDYLDVATILQQPALLGLAMAAQWNEQLNRPVFGTFLTDSFKPLGALLFRHRGDGSAVGLSSDTLDQRSRLQYRAGLSNPMRCGMLAGAVPPRTPQERERLLSQTTTLLSYWNDKLPDAIAEMSDGRPVLLVLDTVEDASVQYAGQLLNLLKLLRTLREQAQQRAKTLGRPPVNLRLVISGRNHLGERDHVPQFKIEFAGHCTEHPMVGLEDREAEAFLRQELTAERRARTPDELVAAMVKKSDGIPFNLSLFAEWANEDATLNAEKVLQSEAVSAVMLIERIVKRIPYQPLRWIIRYGVVPRNLTEAFLRDVMREPLLEALSGQAAASGADKADSRLEQDVWHPEKNFTFDAKALWNDRVLRYASERNWIRPGDHDSQVVFRSDILQPMRQLLGKQAIFERLHQAARDWFEQRAASPDDFVAATVECLYHRVQLRSVATRAGDDLLPALRAFLDAPPLTASVGLRRAVCEELGKPDFDRLAAHEKAYLRYRLAEAIAAQNDYSYRTPEAIRCLGEAFELLASAPNALSSHTPETVLSPFAAVWRRASTGTSVSALVGDLQDVAGDDLSRLSLLIAELSPPRSPLAADALRHAVEAAQPINPAIPLGIVAERLARNLRTVDPDAAIGYFTLAARDFNARGAQVRRSEMLRLASATELGLGRLTRAEDVLAHKDGSVEQTTAVRLQLTRIELSKGNPGAALDLLDRTQASKDSEQIEALLLRAEALSQRMIVSEALAAWEEASRAANQQANTRALSRVAVGQARLYSWWLRATESAVPGSVPSLLQLAQSRRSEAAQRTADAPVADVEIWQIMCDRSEADRWRRRALGEMGGDSPMARVRLTLALCQVMPSLPPRRWLNLVEDAQRLPRSARFTALSDPVLFGRPADIDPRVRQSIADAFEYTPEGPIETAWYAVRYGELLAWLGFYERAADVLAAGVPLLEPSHFGKGWVAAAYRERRRIERRIRGWLTDNKRAPFPAPVPDPPDQWWRFWGHTPFRAAAATLENARTAAEAGEFGIMKACLDLAAPEIERVSIDTEFHGIARDLRRRIDRDSGAGQTANVSPPPPASPEPVAPGRLGGPPFVVFEMREQSGRLAVLLEDPAREAVISAENDTLEILLRSRAIPRRLVGRSLDKMASDLSEVLGAAGLDVHGLRTFLKMRLSSLCSAPWELAFAAAPAPVRLPSGWREPEVEFQSRLERDNHDPRIAASPPLLFQPMSIQDRESPALKVYLQLGSSFRRRLEETTHGPARAVYVASSFIELPDMNEPALAGNGWTAASLAYAIESAVTDVKPAVVLDVPMVATSSDLMHQLLMRNFFAQLLVDSGRVSCVLATGLRPETEIVGLHRSVLPTLLDPMATQIDLYDASARFAREARLRTHDAFFTANPYRPMAVRAFHVA